MQVAGDGVLVISHDVNAKRCFGESLDIQTTPYKGTLDQLETNDEFKQKMPSLAELAQLMVNDARFKGVRLMLDIKRSNEPWVIEKVIDSFRDANPDLDGFWADRLVLGVWRLDVLRACEQYAPKFPILHIGVSRLLADRFLPHPQVVGISLIHFALTTPGGSTMIKRAKEAGKVVYSWTMNDLQLIKWAISENLDGIVTDDPKLYGQFVDGLSENDIATYKNTAPSSFFTWTSMLKSMLVYCQIQVIFAIADLLWFVTPLKARPSSES